MKIEMIILGVALWACQPANSTSENIKGNTVIQVEPNCEVAIQFINNYVVFCNAKNPNIGLLDWVNSQSVVTTGFKLELENMLVAAEKNDPQLGLGFDPIFDAQDYPDKGFEVDKQDSTYVIVKGVDWPDFRLSLRLTLEDGRWLVDGAGVINIPANKRAKR